MGNGVVNNNNHPSVFHRESNELFGREKTRSLHELHEEQIMNHTRHNIPLTLYEYAQSVYR